LIPAGGTGIDSFKKNLILIYFNIKELFTVLGWRFSTGAQYVPLDNKIKCQSLAVFFLATPSIKLELPYMWGLLTAKHLDQSL
jgi:hypothetical protein